MGATNDIERARFNMVEQQIRTWDVLDQQVLNLLFRVRREDYVPASYRALAFADLEIPIGHGEKMLQPKLEARLIQELQLGADDVVLEIGTGTGYMTALMAAMARHVYSVDIESDFTRDAGARLAGQGVRNVTLETGDGSRGWDKNGPYDAIVITGSLPVLPAAFQNSLKTGGRLIAVVGDAPVMEAQKIVRAGPDAYSATGLFETCIPPLKKAQQPGRFVF